MHPDVAQPHHKPEPGRPERRLELIRAAIAVIADHGLSSTTVARVASRAGLSPGIVNFYFKSKDVLLLETLGHLVNEFDDGLAGVLNGHQASAEATLRALVAVQFESRYCDPQKVAVWSAFWGETRARADYLALCSASDQFFLDALTECCARLTSEAGYDHVNAEAVARGLQGMIDGLQQDLLVDASRFDPQRAIESCLAFMRSVFPTHFRDLSEVGDADRTETNSERLLAPWTYFSDELLELELELLFKRNWLLIGHVNELREPGDYLTYDVGGEKALIVRGDDLAVRAFHNVCRHRGSRVVASDRGRCARAIVCPFHGWRYDLRGRLERIPAADSFAEGVAEDASLVPLELETWQGLVFIRFGGDGPSVADVMAPIASELETYRIADMQMLDFGDSRELVPVNWKSLHDIDNEGYHVPVGHPSLHSLLESYRDDFHEHGLVVSRAELRDRPSSHWSVARYQRLLPRFDHLGPSQQRAWFYWGLFPNLSVGVYPEMIEFYQTLPLTVSSTVVLGRCYGLPDPRRETRAARYLNARINAAVGAEDLEMVQWSYEGMRSSRFPRHRLSELERGVADFHESIRRRIPVAGLEQAPSAGTLADRNRLLGH